MSTPTVKEIAKQAGVSPATVSRVVNGTGSVSQEKREKVLAVLETWKLPHAPRQTTRRMKNIGALLPTRPESDSNAILRKLAALAAQLRPNWNLLLLPSGILPMELEARHLRGELEGLLLIGHTTESPDLRKSLHRIPHVWLNSHRSDSDNPTVLMGNEFAGRIAARYLLDKQCECFSTLSIPGLNPGLPGRVSGFRFELFSVEKTCRTLELTLPVGKKWLEECSDEELEQSIIAAVPERLEGGLFSPEERITALLHRVQRRRGGELPLLVSCNHTPEYLTGLYPRPATIDLGAKMLAELALKELLRRISGETPRADDIAVIVTPHLVQGD